MDYNNGVDNDNLAGLVFLLKMTAKLTTACSIYKQQWY
jgi:hypothetical protein